MDYKRSGIGAVALAVWICASCATAYAPAPPRLQGSALSVLDRAEHSNWRVRLNGDTAYEGRVLFLSPSTVRVGRADLALAEVQRIERAYRTEPGGARVGAATGFIIGAMAGSAFIFSFARGMGSECSAVCVLGAGAVFGVMAAFIGGLIGDSDQPAPQDWAVIWER